MFTVISEFHLKNGTCTKEWGEGTKSVRNSLLIQCMYTVSVYCMCIIYSSLTIKKQSLYEPNVNTRILLSSWLLTATITHVTSQLWQQFITFF